MAYQALYRTYRPRRFSEVIGQEHVVRTLLNSIRQGKTGHAYLFSGPRGTGKTTVARLLARAINCESPADGEPCDRCERCKGSEEGLGVLEIDAASHGSVDDMRQLVAQVSQVPLSGGMMVYIIDEVHMLSKEAFNAFLKTLEEPPPHAVFVLATTEPGKLLPTIHSRCQHFAFRRLPINLVADYIRMICEKENVPADEPALRLIARAGDGSVRDSITVLEQAIAYEPDGITLKGVRDVLGIPDRMDIRELGGNIISGDPGKVSSSYAALIESGREPGTILSELLMHFRDLLFASLDLAHSDLQFLPEEETEVVGRQARSLDPDEIHESIAALAKCESEIKWEDEAALLLEVSLLGLASRLPREAKIDTARRAPAERKEAEEAAPEMFPKKEAAPPIEIPKEKPAEVRTPERPSLTGGYSLKRRKPASEVDAASEAPPGGAPKAAAEKASYAAGEPRIPAGIDPLWKNALEGVREASVAEYILLAEAVPSPPLSEWPVHDEKTHGPLGLTLKYPYDAGLLVKLINQPGLLNRITTRLEEVFERPIALRVARERDQEKEEGSTAEAGQLGMYDGEGPVVGSTGNNGPALFPGAAQRIPTDPDLRKIHDLIVEDFPDYTFEQDEAR